MNSYFYKFMINLLKRFSSERKLLEVRGAFIIRLVSVHFPSPHSCYAGCLVSRFPLHVTCFLFLTFVFVKEVLPFTPGCWCY